MKSHTKLTSYLFLFISLLALIIGISNPASAGTPSVSFVAGTSAGWDFQALESDIARNNTVDLGDLSIIAQNWLVNGCGSANQWCAGADLDASTGVDLIDYALLAKDFGKQAGSGILLQTIYGSAQNSAGQITANTVRALQSTKGMAMAFAVPQDTALDTGTFKLTGLSAGHNVEVRLYNVTGKGYLTYNHGSVSRADPGSGGALLADVTVPVPGTAPYHSEGTVKCSDMAINFGPLEVTAGEYLLVFDTVATNLTTGCNMVKGTGATDPVNMGKYPDGTPLPKRATVTTSTVQGNTYYYYLGSSTDANYSHGSDQFACQITTAIINHAPTANAGADQQIVYPVDTVTLAGTATDDGIPNPPGVLTTTWSVTSGPGTVTFGDASAVNTTATFSAIGTYVLRLTANDSALSAFDEVTITYRQNQAPVVNAGTDKTVGTLDTTTLSGTATDDGLPNPPAAITTLWTQQSGPGTATFTNASAASTTVSFSDIGTYVLRLTADDSALSTYDEVTIIVVDGSLNNPPVVNAGTDQEIVLPASASLDGTVTDDGQPNPPGHVTTTWTKTSGPGTVTFGSASLVDTTASFSVDGTYVLRLTANDGSISSYDEVTITVDPAVIMPTYYKMVAHFHTTNSDGAQSLSEMMLKYRDDPNEPRDVACVTDHDYISNGAAYSQTTPRPFLGINGAECSTSAHVIGFGVPGSGAISWGSSLQAEIDSVNSHGGLPWVAHAQWSHDNMGYDMPTLLAGMTNCNIMAVYNGYCQAIWGNGNSEPYWDTLLSSGKHIWGVAEEDTHGWGNKCGFAVTMVKADSFTLDAIKDALVNGNMYFYNSANRWKPCMQLIGYSVSGTTPGSTISISVGDEASYPGSMVAPVTIKFIGNNGAVLKTVTGSSASYTITGTENYVRVKVKDSSVSKEGSNWPSTTIWTQPVWVTP